jgi:hypothetical protein
LDGTAKIVAPPINVVTKSRSKVLSDLNQNGKQPSIRVASSLIADIELPAKKWSLTRPGTQVERGKLRHEVMKTTVACRMTTQPGILLIFAPALFRLLGRELGHAEDYP